MSNKLNIPARLLIDDSRERYVDELRISDSVDFS